MEIDHIFPRRIFSSKISASAKILTEWKTAFYVFFQAEMRLNYILVFDLTYIHIFLLKLYNKKNVQKSGILLSDRKRLPMTAAGPVKYCFKYLHFHYLN